MLLLDIIMFDGLIFWWIIVLVCNFVSVLDSISINCVILFVLNVVFVFIKLVKFFLFMYFL